MSSFPHPQVHAEETQFPGVSFCQSLMEDSMMTSGNADFTEYRHMIYVESHVKSQNNKKNNKHAGGGTKQLLNFMHRSLL